MPPGENLDVLFAPYDALRFARGITKSKPAAKERGLGSEFPTMAGGPDEWARDHGYALDFLTEDRIAELRSKRGRPYPEPSPYAERLRQHGYASDFLVPDSPAAANLGTAEQDRPAARRSKATARANGASSSVGATYSDPRLTAQLQSGPGILLVGSAAQNFARAETVRAIEMVGEQWAALHPNGPRIRVGGIGVVYGGLLQRGSKNGVPLFHKSHQLGVDADIRLMRNDGKEADTTISSGAYSRGLTASVISLFFSQTILPVDRIFFNDSLVSGVEWQEGHDNHFHVRFGLK